MSRLIQSNELLTLTATLLALADRLDGIAESLNTSLLDNEISALRLIAIQLAAKV